MTLIVWQTHTQPNTHTHTCQRRRCSGENAAGRTAKIAAKNTSLTVLSWGSRSARRNACDVLAFLSCLPACRPSSNRACVVHHQSADSASSGTAALIFSNNASSHRRRPRRKRSVSSVSQPPIAAVANKQFSSGNVRHVANIGTRQRRWRQPTTTTTDARDDRAKRAFSCVCDSARATLARVSSEFTHRDHSSRSQRASQRHRSQRGTASLGGLLLGECATLR